MIVRFRVTMPNGRIIVGPIHGSGGMSGSGALHAGLSFAQKHALAAIRQAQRLARRGRRTHVYEPEPGCVAVYPDYCAAKNGHAAPVPLLESTFAVAE